MSIRLGVAAIIVRDGKLLLVAFDDETGPHYNLPGGGVETGETLEQALRREVREETCAEITSVRLAEVYEYVPALADYIYGDRHKVSLWYECSLLAGHEPRCPDEPDVHQVGIAWVPLDQLSEIVLIPPSVVPVVRALYTG